MTKLDTILLNGSNIAIVSHTRTTPDTPHCSSTRALTCNTAVCFDSQLVPGGAPDSK